MIGLMGGVLQCCEDVIFFEEGIVFEDFFVGGAVGEQVEEVGNPETVSTNAGLPAAFA